MSAETLAALLEAEVERLAEAASLACPPCRSVDESFSCAVQPCGPHCRYPYTDERPPICESCGPRHNARRNIAAAFGSSDRATAIMLVLVLNAKTPCLLNECGQCAQCISRALIRDLAAALGVEEEVVWPECPSCAVALAPGAAHAGDCEILAEEQSDGS